MRRGRGVAVCQRGQRERGRAQGGAAAQRGGAQGEETAGEAGSDRQRRADGQRRSWGESVERRPQRAAPRGLTKQGSGLRAGHAQAAALVRSGTDGRRHERAETPHGPPLRGTSSDGPMADGSLARPRCPTPSSEQAKPDRGLLPACSPCPDGIMAPT